VTIPTLEFKGGALWLLDQTVLPHETTMLECLTHQEVAAAIRRLSVRGAPAIGLAAAYGLVLAAQNLAESEPADSFRPQLRVAAAYLRSSRPTAVNLMWAIDRMMAVLDAHPDALPHGLCDLLRAEADSISAEDLRANTAMGDCGREVVPQNANVLTHCNAGALATGAVGTAVGVIMAAHTAGKSVHVWVDETRPLLQGARLTTWELKEAGVPHTLITDNMAAHFMARGAVDLVIVGADRIAANGDGANKIGTYGVAVLAHAHGIPFYFAAPTSTIDLSTPDGGRIEIEERAPEEVTSFRGVRTAPEGTHVANPAFDVTPARLVTGIITEVGVVRAPFEPGLRDAVTRARAGHATFGKPVSLPQK
jgi:methylthioribose-1-phosphate isomerase